MFFLTEQFFAIAQFAGVECFEQAFEKKAAVEPREDVDWQEEAGAAGDPTSIGREAAARHNAMDVRVMGQGLAPAVQDCDHAGLGAEIFGIGSDGADRLGRGLEEDIVDDRLVLQGDRCERGRHGEDEMEIRDWQKFGAAIGQPLGAREPLALGTVPIAAGIIGDTDLAAVLALLDMPAERRGAARLDGGHDAALGLREPAALRRAERIAVAAENIRHLQDGAHAPGSVWRDDLNREPIKRAGCARDELRRNLSVARRRSQIAVSQPNSVGRRGRCRRATHAQADRLRAARRASWKRRAVPGDRDHRFQSIVIMISRAS